MLNQRQQPKQGAILEGKILLTVGRPVAYGAGIRGKPLGGRPPNPLSLVLTEGEQIEKRLSLHKH